MNNSPNYPVETLVNKAVIIDKNSYLDKNLFFIAKEHYNYIDKIVITRGMVMDRIERLAHELISENEEKTFYFLIVIRELLCSEQI